jgi:hypothetical protein
MFGLMGALANSSLQKLGILYQGTLTWQVGMKWCGVFLEVGIVRDPMMGARVVIKHFI